jgi:hypothetical protein
MIPYYGTYDDTLDRSLSFVRYVCDGCQHKVSIFNQFGSVSPQNPSLGKVSTYYEDQHEPYKSQCKHDAQSFRTKIRSSSAMEPFIYLFKERAAC